MAVEKSKIIARLKALFPKANLSQKRLDDLSAKLCLKPADDADDAAVDAVINGFNDIFSFEAIAKEDDRVRTLEAKAKGDGGTSPEGGTPPKNDPAPDDTPSWAKALIESNQKLTAKVETLEAGKVAENKKQTATELFQKSEILKDLKEDLKPNWISRINIDSETPVEDQIKGLETEYQSIKQQFTDLAGGLPFSGTTVKDPTKEEIDGILNEII